MMILIIILFQDMALNLMQLEVSRYQMVVGLVNI